MDFPLERSQWDNMTVEYGQMLAVGEFDAPMPPEGIAVAFAPHDRVIWSVDGGDRQTTAVPAGSVLLYASRQLVWHYREQPSDWLHITLNPQFLNQIALENGFPENLHPEHRVIFPDATILQIAQLLKTEVLSSSFAGKLLGESLRNVLAIHLLRHYGHPAKPGNLSPLLTAKGLSPMQLHQVKTHIEEHLAEDLSLAELAALVPMSEFHFARLFKATTGETPYRYGTQRRIDRAKVLLAVTQLAVAEVAYRVGFANPSHFTAQFRKLVGQPPNNTAIALPDVAQDSDKTPQESGLPLGAILYTVQA